MGELVRASGRTCRWQAGVLAAAGDLLQVAGAMALHGLSSAVLYYVREVSLGQKSGETDKAYQARMLLLITEAKQRSDAVAAAAKKKAEDAEKGRMLAIEQQRQQDEAAAKAAEEERIQRREKIFSAERALEDIHSLDDTLAQVNSRLQQLEQRPVAAPDAISSNPSDRLEALEIDVGSLKDGMQLQQTATQQLEQRICTAATHSRSEPHDTTPKIDGQDIFCGSTKTDPIPWFRKFKLKLQLHHVSEHKHHEYLYSWWGGACQAWLDNILSKYGVVAVDLHTKISWDDLKATWHKRFEVEPPEIKAMDKLMTFEQGTLPSVDWIAEYQRLTSVPDIQMGFKAVKHFFISRSCLALGNALTHVKNTLMSTVELFDKAVQIIVRTRRLRTSTVLLDQFVLVYLDDFLVYSRTLEDHLEHLRRVLETLRRAKYKANRDKCELVRQELEYLGHFVTPEGIRPLLDKIQAIQEWSEPRNVTDVRSFLGLAGYYTRFIKGYSKIAAHLTKLQCEDRSFDFGEDAQESFLALKAALLSAEVLRIYDPLLPTRITTDASGYGIGVVHEQHDGVDWHPVEYFSKKVPVVHSIDDARKELLAFVHALKRWRHFLLVRSQFQWVTDNNPLVFYKTQDTVNSTIARWMPFIDQFDFFPDHIPRKSNRFANALSRSLDHCTQSIRPSRSATTCGTTSSAATKPTSSFETHTRIAPLLIRRLLTTGSKRGTCLSTRGGRTFFAYRVTLTCVHGFLLSSTILLPPDTLESITRLAASHARFADTANPATIVRTTEVAYPVIHEEFDDMVSLCRFRHSDKSCKLGEAVYYDEDVSFPGPAGDKCIHEVHGNTLARTFGNRQGLEKPKRSLSSWFVALANLTGFSIFLGI
ncbi:hypothetical protein CBR_g40936 [Chara braunii]|uniref:Reverse transcriptase/retrotransposon-derived protein RNase H-like domain-containing protein n=1 Tax=Chara braunii TaxID=69332 RepID=A0A388LUU9_CHABU|nr:hypothetical protein CBR_g40936 [Chara braunii]|eukprot:GBG86035.1 hypothetical protein CBR_g40936 [Chara braunii]